MHWEALRFRVTIVANKRAKKKKIITIIRIIVIDKRKRFPSISLWPSAAVLLSRSIDVIFGTGEKKNRKTHYFLFGYFVWTSNIRRDSLLLLLCISPFKVSRATTKNPIEKWRILILCARWKNYDYNSQVFVSRKKRTLFWMKNRYDDVNDNNNAEPNTVNSWTYVRFRSEQK